MVDAVPLFRLHVFMACTGTSLTFMSATNTNYAWNLRTQDSTAGLSDRSFQLLQEVHNADCYHIDSGNEIFSRNKHIVTDEGIYVHWSLSGFWRSPAKNTVCEIVLIVRGMFYFMHMFSAYCFISCTLFVLIMLYFMHIVSAYYVSFYEHVVCLLCFILCSCFCLLCGFLTYPLWIHICDL